MNFAACRRRWGDNDRYLGPFCYARDGRAYRPLAIVLSSGGDEYPGASLRFSGFGHTLIIALPSIIKPWKRWVDTSRYEWSTSPNGGYWDIQSRSFGFSYSEGFLQVFHGPQTHDSWTDKTWTKFLPWTQWRHVRKSFYGINGEHVATLPDTGKSYTLDSGRWERERAIEKATPTVCFEFDDFDGERLTATTKIEEMEWKFGTGWFKWLSLFRKPKVRRSLDIEFSGETGERKGSWKGGTLGTGIDMTSGELHESAFRRYCEKNRMTFVGSSTEAA
ncbi:hypothetical protein [Mesorhizobium sp. M1A.F.Ca.IN.020.04.1.1]|uniref:hypothetical protein n=1 Tax=Mesorhizobium sp. M1A.F.Ca.IN.020.04.1.1 TaxID=2496761 RepID=UPI000FCA0979|nr:hypothetical protein [Mesorhizobium sp. M1A.F.Ca.IN.020.04.1.1]RUW04030.1 hypothetical protein EOA49_00435 [Mesorhizobium sp. M1A.F.Ca.IN.020.04.1.1]RUW04093.1 hypothetical protein EOA49_00770 [Mesorhizobium sp. M1A.F.Ca.IN.020.04.1.1]